MDDLPSPVSRRDFLAGLGMGFGYSVLVDASDFASAHAAEATPEQIRESFKLIAPPSPDGKPVAGFQNTRFKLAECATEAQVARVFVDKCIELLLEGKLDAATAAMAKYWVTDLECKVIDECLQLHGGYGFMWEFPISRAYVDARVQRIYGGTNEIMKEVISRSIGLGEIK